MKRKQNLIKTGHTSYFVYTKNLLLKQKIMSMTGYYLIFNKQDGFDCNVNKTNNNSPVECLGKDVCSRQGVRGLVQIRVQAFQIHDDPWLRPDVLSGTLGLYSYVISSNLRQVWSLPQFIPVYFTKNVHALLLYLKVNNGPFSYQ